jgi:hypothetical protein
MHSHRVDQYIHLRSKLLNAQAVNDEKLEDQLLDEMDEIWWACCQEELDEIQSLTRPDDKSSSAA